MEKSDKKCLLVGNLLYFCNFVILAFMLALNNYEQNRPEQSFDTVFTYHLTTQEKQESAVAGLEDLINTMPITLVTQSKKIKQVRVIDRVKGTNVVYTCDSTSLGDNVQLSVVKIDDITKKYLSYITDEVALTTEVNIGDGIYEIIKRDSKQPVLYRYQVHYPAGYDYLIKQHTNYLQL